MVILSYGLPMTCGVRTSGSRLGLLPSLPSPLARLTPTAMPVTAAPHPTRRQKEAINPMPRSDIERSRLVHTTIDQPSSRRDPQSGHEGPRRMTPLDDGSTRAGPIWTLGSAPMGIPPVAPGDFGSTYRSRERGSN